MICSGEAARLCRLGLRKCVSEVGTGLVADGGGSQC